MREGAPAERPGLNIGVAGLRPALSLGFVLHFLGCGASPAERPGLNAGGPPAAGVLSDGVSFCIIGENPEDRIQNPGEGCMPLARVLSDGGFVGMVFNSPCFWCCFVPNYASHYTILFDKCQMLNEINRGYLPRKGTKGILKHEGTKNHEVFFDGITG